MNIDVLFIQNKRNKYKVGFVMNKDEEGVDDDVWFSDAPPTVCL